MLTRHLAALTTLLLLTAPALGAPDPADAIDSQIDDDEKAVLLATVGHAPPALDGNVQWRAVNEDDPEDAPSWDDLRGRIVVLQSFTSASSAGRASLRRIEALLSAYEPEDIQLICVHTPQGADRADDFIASRGAPGPVAIDTKGRFCDDMGIWKRPLTIVIDKQGAIRYPGVGLADVRNVIDELARTPFDPSADAPETVPTRSPSDAAPVAEKKEPDLPFPPHNSDVGKANNLQGRKGPDVQAEHWIGGRPDTGGKVVMIDFWATWCGPCVRSIPHLNNLQRAFPDDLVIIGVSAENFTTVRNFVRQRRIDYAIAVDPNRRMQKPVQNRTIPHAIVMSPDGIVRWQGHPARLNENIMSRVVAASRPAGAAAGPAGKFWALELDS